MADLGPGWAGGGAFVGAIAGLVGGSKLVGAVFDAVDPALKLSQDATAATRRGREVLVPATREGSPVRRVDPFSVAVLKSAAAEEYRKRGADRPPYIKRTIDPILRRAISDSGAAGGVVVVRGHPKAGKSRTLWEALAATPATRNRALYAIQKPSGHDVDGLKVDRPFPTFLDADLGLDGPSSVILVDDAHDHFEYGLTLTRIQDLCDRYPGVIVAMTVHTHRLTPPVLSTDETLTAVDPGLLDRLRELSDSHELDVELDEAEKADARHAYPGLEETIEDPDDFACLPGWFAGVTYLRRRYREAGPEYLGGRAVAKAAIDWRRAGMPMGMTDTQLRQLADVALDELGRGMGFRDDAHYEESLDWAAGRDATADPRWNGIALLRPLKGSQGALWRDFDAVTTWASTGPIPDPPLSAMCWQAVLYHVTAETGISVGVAADRSGERVTAERAFRIAIGHPDEAPMAMYNLGILLVKQDGREADVERAFGEAIKTGHPAVAPMAMVALGGLLSLLEGRADEAERAFDLAIETGHADAAPMAMLGLGQLAEQADRADKAERAYRQAIETRHPEHAPFAMVSLGILLEGQADRADKAERAYRHAIETRHLDHAPWAMVGLGILLGQQAGRADEAERAFDLAIETGHPDHAPMAMMNRGNLLAKQTDRADEAERAYRHAIESGHPVAALGAMLGLGSLLGQQAGRADEAERAFDLAIESGHPAVAPVAMYNLGTFLEQNGRTADAERAYRQAINTGHPIAAGQALEALGAMDRTPPAGERPAD